MSWGYIHVYYHFSQVSLLVYISGYRTIGPLVTIYKRETMCYSYYGHVFLMNYVYLWHWYKRTYIAELKTITAQNTHLPIFAVICSALVICIYRGKRGLRARI